jgi:PAS domain S-box-containing protein
VSGAAGSPPSRKGSDRRDVLVVVATVVVLAVLGAATDAFDLLQPLLSGSGGAVDDLVGAAVLMVMGLAVLALLQARRTRLEIAERVGVEERLRAEDHRWHQLLEDLPVVAYEAVLDDAGDVVDHWMGHGIEGLLGVPVDAWRTQDDMWAQMLHPDDRDAVLAEWETLRRGARFDMQYRMIRADGAVVWVHDRAVRNHRDGLVVIQGAFADVTASKAAEAALQLAEERFRTLVEQLPAVVFSEEPETGDLTYVSPQIEAIYGYTAEEWTADRTLWQQRLHPEDRDSVVAENAADTGDTWSVDYRSITKDGSTIWLHNEARLLRGREGEPLMWQGLVTDITERKLAEQRVRDAEERFRTLVEQLPVAVYTDAVDEQSTAVYISPQYETLTGYPPEQRLREQDLWVRMLHPDDRERVLAESAVTNETGQPFDTEYRIVAADGRVVWVHDHAVLVHDEHGIPRWHGVLQDVTGQHLASDAIARRDAILEATGFAAERFLRAGSWEEDLDEVLRRLAVAGDATRCAVFRNHELPDGRLGVSLVAAWPDDAPSPDTDRTRRGFPWEAGGFERWVRELGAGRPIHGSVESFPASERALLEAEPLPIRSLAAVPVFVDDEWWGYISFDHVDEGREWLEADVEALAITARTIAAAIERQRAEERYRAIVEHVPAVIYLDKFGPEMQTVYISPQLEEVLGVTPERWIREPSLWLELIDPDERPTIETSYRRALGAGEPWHGEYRVRTPDGRIVWLHDETTFLRDADDTPTFVQGVLFDITERKLAEQALRESEQREREAAERLRALDDMKNTFLAAVSHELRSPLTTILGLALTLERAPDIGGHEREDLLTRLSANARKLDRLLKDLLDIDRLHRGIVEPQYRVTDVGALARRTVEHLDATGDRTVHVRTTPVVIAVDPPKVERIIENLVMNAVRHTDADRTIWIGVDPSDEGVEIVVQDDGPGVPPELRTAIFEPFRQGPTASPHAPGTGIGLSLVARFAELHGGRAWVDERPGGGAAFHVELPAAAEPWARTDEARVAGAG